MIRPGDYGEALADAQGINLLLCDPPYSERTHTKQPTEPREDGYDLHSLDFAHWSPSDVRRFVQFFAPRVRGWWVIFTDHMAVPDWAMAMTDIAGLYVFAPLPYVAPGSRVRLRGDGPSSWTCWIVVARPRDKAFFRGALDGSYILPKGLPQSQREHAIIGGKPLWLMERLIEDYSDPGHLVCDPCSGGGTTGLAAINLGRRFVGAELDPERAKRANQRIIAEAQASLLWPANRRQR